LFCILRSWFCVAFPPRARIIEPMSDNPPSANSYDTVPYDSNPMPQTHPDRLATVARLFGLDAPAVERCRVLELGCAAGGNLVPMAHDLPESQFVGVDYSAVQIKQGRPLIEALGLKNIELKCASILDVDSSYGVFDFLICHGVYSWVPAPVQEKILEIAATMLSPNGIAYISYNTYPGWHMRGVVREMMRYHAMRFPDPGRRVREARMILDFVGKYATGMQSGPYTAFLRSEAEMLRKLPDHYIFHEHLEDNSEPIYFHEFVARARARGLDFLGEARLGTMVPSHFGDEANQALSGVATNAIELEQFMDFLRNRAFRETLLHTKGRIPQYTLQPEMAYPMFIASTAKPEKTPIDLRLGEKVTFKSYTGWPITTGKPLMKAALGILTEVWPAPMAFDELVKLARERIAGIETAMIELERDRNGLGRALLTIYTSSDLLEMSISPPRFTTQPGPRPRASGLARRQSMIANTVTTFRHEMIQLQPLDVRVLQRLDGSKTTAELAGDLGVASREIEKTVQRLARYALLAA
jgi:SAM-dependent methyltransferase/methyltransferase-like protein